MCIRDRSSSDIYVSIALVEEIIERQIKKYKRKLIDKKQSALSFSEAFIKEEYDMDDQVRIMKTKKFGVKPMESEEDVCYTHIDVYKRQTNTIYTLVSM